MPSPDQTPAPRKRSRRRTWQLRAMLITVALGFSALAAEGLLQVAPGLLPSSFREHYPPHGIEFFNPGILDRTLLTAVPLPYGVEPYDGPPPHQNADFGVASMEDTLADRNDVPRLVVPADADGLPNRERPAHPDLVLVGDSFTMFAAQEQPIGLQRSVESNLKVEVLNLGIAGIGPDQELWLLETLGVPSKPRVVVWFFYGGNDFVDAFWLRWNQNEGLKTYGDLFAKQRVPSLLLPSLIGSWFRQPAAKNTNRDVKPLAPLVMRNHPDVRMWFYPDVLRMICLPPQLLRQQTALQGITDILRRARTSVEAAGAQFLVVYLPSKEQLYLPHVHPEPELLLKYARASTFVGAPMSEDPDKFFADLLANCGALEAEIANFCQQESMHFWSATPSLSAACETGAPLYYRTDTHWRAEGQLVVVPGLCEQLVKLGVKKQ